MKLSQFKYKLTDERIAQEPTPFRDDCRLMVVHAKSKYIEHRKSFRDVLDFFDEKDVFAMEKPAQNQYKSPYSKEVDKPMLELKVTGPTRTKVGDRFNYVVRVKNSGTGTAKNVTITNKLPWGISLTSDPETKNFTMKAGDMVPGCVKTFTFEAAPDFAGIFIDYVSASGANAHVKHSSLCTKVINRR